MTFHDHRAPRPAAAPPAAKQPGPVTRALRAMQATLTKPTRTGPVTDAIRAMRAADPAFDANPDLIALRRALANRIEADIAALDMLGGDHELEADYAMTMRAADGSLYLLGCSTDREPSLCGAGTHEGGSLHGLQPHCGGDDREDDAGENPEEENEHGGDIVDEPHDREEDCDEDERGLRFARYNPAHEIRKRELVLDAQLGVRSARRRIAARHA